MATSTGIKPQELTAAEAAEIAEAEAKVARYLELERDITSLRAARDAEVELVVEKFADRLKPLEEERRTVGNRLYELAQTLIPRFGKKKTVKLHAGQLSFKQEREKLKIIDEQTALKAIRARRWAKTCIKYKPSINIEALKKMLKASGVRLELPGTQWLGGTEDDQLLYVNSNIKVEPTTPPGEGHDESENDDGSGSDIGGEGH